jgi:hypothetical protein
VSSFSNYSIFLILRWLNLACLGEQQPRGQLESRSLRHVEGGGACVRLCVGPGHCDPDLESQPQQKRASSGCVLFRSWMSAGSDAVGWEAICSGLRRNATLRLFVATHCSLGNDSTVEFAKLIDSGFNNIHTMDLSHNSNIGYDGTLLLLVYCLSSLLRFRFGANRTGSFYQSTSRCPQFEKYSFYGFNLYVCSIFICCVCRIFTF